MGIIISTTKAYLSKRPVDGGASAPNMGSWWMINTGNGTSPWKFNNTYTSEGGDELEIRLWNYDECIWQRGDTIGGENLQDDFEYLVWGAPQKFNYELRQKYNNCGVESALNILSMAGVVDVVEKDQAVASVSEYGIYINTPVKYKTDEITGEKTPVYPSQIKIDSEESILLWAIDNHCCLSTADGHYYEDPSDIYYEDGGTYISGVHTKDWWGNFIQSTCDIVTGYAKANGAEVEATKEKICMQVWYDKTSVKTESYSYDEEAGTVTVTTETTEGDFSAVEQIMSNNLKYNFSQDFLDAIIEGRGMIISGNAHALNDTLEEGYGGHAITLVGGVVGTTYYDDEHIFDNDIQGVYVVDTGGWLDAGAQYITVDKLYDFLTAVGLNADGTIKRSGSGRTSYELPPEIERDENGNITSVTTTTVYYKDYCDQYVCTGNIRLWADELNLVGNDQQNFLWGNDSANTIHGKKSSDVLYGKGGNDTLYGDEDNDTLFGGAGNDTLYGGSGNDVYVFCKSDGVSHDTIIPGSGIDTIYFSSELEPDEDFLTHKSVQWTELKYYQTATNDLVIEYPSSNNPADEKSSITVKGYFKGSTANNIPYIKFDALRSTSKITYEQYLLNHGYSKEYVRANYTAAELERTGYYPVAETKNLQSLIDSVEYVPAYNDRGNKMTGTSHSNTMIGTDYNDTINGAGGDDILTGGAGDDIIKGGKGSDIIYASYGHDKIYGEYGTNHYVYDRSKYEYNGSDTIYSGKGEDILELRDSDVSDLRFAKSGKNLIIVYDQTKGSSITITNYFTTKGSSVKNVIIGDKPYSLATLVGSNYVDSVKTSSAGTSTIGDDTITTGSGNDVINGGLGNDIIKAGSGNDTITGGKGNDRMYGQGGDNTYIFNYADGSDTIYTSGSGTTTLDFTAMSITKAEAANLSYIKSGNNLIINYGRSDAEYDVSKITISGYFKSKAPFRIACTGGEYFDLANAEIALTGLVGKKNKITGSKYNDFIVGKELNDTLKGGAGDDTIIGGAGNDNITGGSGKNLIIYNKGDGNDTINLTKGEELTIKFADGFTSSKDLSYAISGKNLVISYLTDDGVTQKLTLKNYAKSDVTKGGMVKLQIGSETLEIPSLDIGLKYSGFTSKKYKYTGKWLSETIDASQVTATNKKGRGVYVNAGAGYDTVYGSQYNDTIYGGAGNDVIVSNGGTNKIDGGAGSDIYYLYASTSAGETLTTINDVVGGADKDIVYLCDDNLFEKYDLWININKGVYDLSQASSILIATENDTYKKSACVTMKGIDSLRKVDGNSVVDITTVDSDPSVYKEYDIMALQSEIDKWFNKYGYYSSDQALQNNNIAAIEDFQNILAGTGLDGSTINCWKTV